MNEIKNFKLWCIFFLYSFCVSVLVQFVLLPYVFPSFHAGNGLLNSSFDSRGFHQLAVDVADKIRTQGWSAWELRPSGQGPAGISSIFYFFILPDPRILIPISAAFHASAALVLVNILNLFVKNKTNAILCVLPFLVFPSNLQWTAQWHKDLFSILGVVFILQGMVSLARVENYQDRHWFFINLRATVFFICGSVLVWVMRPFMITMMLPFVGLFFVLLFSSLAVRMLKRKISLQKIIVALLFMTLISLIISQKPSLSPAHSREKILPVLSEEKMTEYKKEEVSQPVVTAGATAEKLIVRGDIENHWKRSFWLPLSIENKAYSLAKSRRGFRIGHREAKSSIDVDVGFGSIKDILMYLPRAAQIALLAPFPYQWFGEGSMPANSLMRRISGFEMMVTYFALFFLPYAIWYWRKRIEIWIVFLFCFYMILIYALTVCNVGSLYRMRYVFITTLVALGIAGFIAFLGGLKTKRKIK